MKQELLGVKAPKMVEGESDINCPFHGKINVKNETINGVVVKKDSHGTATIEWKSSIFVPKYERSQIKTRRIRVHNPACINAEVGQKVMVARTRPISRTKHHVIIKIYENEKVELSLGESAAEDRAKKSKRKAKVVEEKVEKSDNVAEPEVIEESKEDSTEEKVPEEKNQ